MIVLQNWWYTTLLNTKVPFQPPLRGHLATEVLVVGGGIAGLHAALYLARAGKKVVILERNICGGSSTGKSAGFLTPDSELELSQLLRRYGKDDAKKVWGIAVQGVEQIVNTIKEYGISCDLQKQDSLFVGIGKSGSKAVDEEVESRNEVGFASTQYKDEGSLRRVNTGIGYTAGVRYTDTYSMNPMLYAQELKGVLLGLGVRIYESTEVTAIKVHTAETHLGSVTAEHIIVCIDKMMPSISPVAEQVYHAQTFLSISEPLDDKDIQAMFPETSNIMCWDSTLIYSYYRFTGDRRLLLGGGSAATTFLPKDITIATIINDVVGDFKKRFPMLKQVNFIQYWPGRIDTTKDLVPIVDFDPEMAHLQFVLGCVGLPWAAFCGYYAARRMLEPAYCHEYCDYLKINRWYLVPAWLQGVLGKMITFSLNNAYSKYWQHDVGGGHPNQHGTESMMRKKQMTGL